MFTTSKLLPGDCLAAMCDSLKTGGGVRNNSVHQDRGGGGHRSGAVPPGGGGGRGGSEWLQQLCSVSEAAGVEFRTPVRRYCPAYRLLPPPRQSPALGVVLQRGGTIPTPGRLQASRGLRTLTAAAVSGSQNASFLGPAEQAAHNRSVKDFLQA